MKLNYFRPKARHIFTIWRDLIKDDFSALIELVKNSYDADSPSVEIEFYEDKWNLVLIIRDYGNWMSENEFRENWLAPSNDHKKYERVSPKGRVFQWQKWIWRYAASVLWDKLILRTIKSWKRTIITINWSDFNDKDKFLDEINLDIKTDDTKEKNGTTIIIIWDSTKLQIWNNKTKKEKLLTELKKLKPPFISGEDFLISWSYFWDKFDISNDKLLEFYDYKVTWIIKDNWEIDLVYENADLKEQIPLNFISKEIFVPGNVKFKFLVADQDTLIHEREEISRQLWRFEDRKEGIDYFKKFAWISIYRGDFRIRPYWEQNEDWLDLNMRRYNDPTFRLSSNQILGYVIVESDEASHLIEASSRERLKDNEYFEWLKNIIREILSILEEKRFVHRRAIWIWTKKIKSINIEEKLENIKNSIDWIETSEDKDKLKGKIEELGEDFKKEKERLENIITQYEWQVTLGKLLAVTFHETSKPTRFMRDNVENVEFYIDKFERSTNSVALQYKTSLIWLLKWYALNAKILSDFMSKNLQPLVRWKGLKAKNFHLISILKQAFHTFQKDIENNKINISLNISPDLVVHWFEKDFLIAFVNFIDNSIYWLSIRDGLWKHILVESVINTDIGEVYLYFKDTWLWVINIKPDDFGQLFEPGFTRKEDWSWLWLSIAWEVLEKNWVNVEILEANTDFNFILKLTIPLCQQEL